MRQKRFKMAPVIAQAQSGAQATGSDGKPCRAQRRSRMRLPKGARVGAAAEVPPSRAAHPRRAKLSSTPPGAILPPRDLLSRVRTLKSRTVLLRRGRPLPLSSGSAPGHSGSPATAHQYTEHAGGKRKAAAQPRGSALPISAVGWADASGLELTR